MTNALETNDVQLTAGDIGLLENATQIISFFARLRYDVDNAAPLSHAALNMDTDELRYQVRAIYQVATDPDEEIRVYLMEVRSVTVRLKHMLAQRFRNRPELPLLILTDDDFETFDFVLIDRSREKSKQPGQAEKQVIRPRSLTVSRRNPEPVALRVLRRFTYTEADYLYQWEKLRSAFTLAEWSEPYFNNRALFSDYYLKNRLADPAITPAWDEDVRPTGRAVFDLLGDARRRFSGRPEAEIRAGLIEPLLQQLGFALVPVRDARSSAERPDYFLRDPADPNGPNLAAALTSVWNRNLDDVDPTRDPDTPDEIPGARVVSVLEQGDAPWVIMTNGKLWRLYAAAADNKATNYYEVDLEEALYADDQLTALKYWWLLFRRDAFGGGLLDTVLQASQEYAKELGERLKERIFVEIFPHFARGFIANARRRQPAASPDETFLQQTFAGTLTFLYRLMFILYAESLELLPVVEARGYGEHSLRRLKKEIAEKAGPISDQAPEQIRAAYSDGESALYDRLQALFAAINDGRADWNLPVYNGGLFSPESDAGRFLAQQAIPDRHLALGLDLLARDVDEKSQALAFIDYKDLGVRHLGSIYEGLLEFRLRIATEPLVVVKEKGRERYLPAAEAGSRRAVGTVAPGEVYLENDKRERKATGSYYTPDYIVKYIVEHTVGPVLERKFEALAPRLRDAQRQYRQHKQRVTGRGGDQDPANFWNKPEMQRLADACLDVRVLDPAMGSGHFLVEVVDFTSNRLLDFLNGWSENPVWGMLEQMRRDILEDVESQGVSIDAGRLTRVALLKRSVLKRCIYGVDLNEMAVELAKVSLWLDAFTLGAPLSFLDHHLKQGNSLIGARIREVEEAVAGAQRDLFTPQHFVQVGQAVQGMREVSFRPDNTPEQVAASRQQYRSALQNVAPLKRVLDVYTSRWFGNEPSKAFDPALYFLQQPEALAWRKEPATPLPERGGVELQAIADTTLQARDAHHFFHWELEFPEVFFAPGAAGGQDVELREDGGFDAVVGNPPYIPTEQLAADDKNWFAGRYVLERKYETSVIFSQASLDLISPSGRVGLITPVMWETGENYSGFRKEVLTVKYQPIRVVNLPFNVFPDAYIDTGIQILGVTGAQECISVLNFSKQELITKISDDDPRWECVPREYMSEEPGAKLYLRRELYEILRKMRHPARFATLGDLTTSCQGIVESFYTYTSEKQHQNQLSYKNLEAYRYEYSVRDERFIDIGVTDSLYPYYTSPRLLIRRIVSRSNRLMAIKAEEPFVVKKDLNPFVLNENAGLSLDYLLALLNSSLISFLYTAGSTASLRDDFRQTTLGELNSLPIRRIEFTTPMAYRHELVSQLLLQISNRNHDSVYTLLDQIIEEGHTDVLHDLLSTLAVTMIKLNQEKQSEKQRFITSLEGLLRIRASNGETGIPALVGSTIIQNYLGDYQKGEPELPWSEMEYRLYQNRGRFAANWAAVKGEVQVEYEKSLEKLRPIKQRLAETDALIDKIVYRLYGLTDDEIRLIEQPAYEQALAQAKESVAADRALQQDPEQAAAALADRLLPAAQRLLQRVETAAERATLDRDLPGWERFPGDVPTFLLTGEYNIRHQPDHLDFSTSIVSYAKAVETMLFRQLFAVFREESGRDPAAAHGSILREFLDGTRDRLTLGAMRAVLSSSQEKALRRFAAARFHDAAARLFGDAGVIALLADESVIALRNAAVHDEVMTRADAQAARAWAVGVLEKL